MLQQVQLDRHRLRPGGDEFGQRGRPAERPAPGPLLPGLAVLAGWALVAYVVSMLAFRWND